jgi:ribulose-phosphate 3-epimerase
MKTLIAPSLLSADFSRLASQIEEAERAGADLFHVDVMDGHFVPNITFGPIIVSAIRKLTKLPLDVHLMISDPGAYCEQFIKAGSNYLTFHIEACREPAGLIERIRSLGAKPGLVLNPPTPFSQVEPFLGSLDLLLVMTVNPGFGGQGFIKDALPKAGQARKARERLGASFLIEVDGGMNDKTGALAVAEGADMLVAGNYIFASPDIKAAVKKLREATEAV